jgi:hypothetical protein
VVVVVVVVVVTGAMIGGALWCIGNSICLQVIKMIGMSLGLMIWGSVGAVVSESGARNKLFLELNKKWKISHWIQPYFIPPSFAH